jgi:hypothetical protein
VRENDLPAPPTFNELSSWAGKGRVVRASPDELAQWRLPSAQKAALIASGVPLMEDMINTVTFRSAPPLYRLAEERHEVVELMRVFGAEPETGRVFSVMESDGHTWFVNSSVSHWLCSLHRLGTWLTTSTIATRWDEDIETEEAALAELADLADEIRRVDPAAFEGDDHSSWYWPAVLDRWLY